MGSTSLSLISSKVVINVTSSLKEMWQSIWTQLGESGTHKTASGFCLDRNNEWTHISLHLTFLITAAPGWAADTPDVAAAMLGAALAPTYSNQQEEEEATQDDEEYCEPVYGRNGERKRILAYLVTVTYQAPFQDWRNTGSEEEKNRRRYLLPRQQELT